MSHSIFRSALRRALLRRPLSRPLFARLGSSFSNSPETHAEVPLRQRGRAGIANAVSRESQWPKKAPRDLLTLLHSLGCAVGIAESRQGKVDLSRVNPFTPAYKRRQTQWRQWSGFSLRGITECFIYWLYYKAPAGTTLPALDEELLKQVFTKREIRYLESKGYRPEDVLVWAWILMARDGKTAGLKLDLWTSVGVKIENSPSLEISKWFTSLKGIFHPDVLEPPPQPITRAPHIPPFLLLFLLRHPHLQRSTIFSLLPHIRHALTSTIDDQKTPLLIIIRLLRHVRSSWPSAIPFCAHLTVTHLHPTPPRPSKHLTRTYNRLLSLFSHPTHTTPFKFLPFTQRSQFLLLRKMAALDIPITREGYRALTSVQLAHRKTPPEAAHARSLSPHWPPWPIPRDGHHRSTPHTHLSRAAQILQQMSEAGYAHLGWEQEALVLSGTDTDSSPTIQTRTFYAGRSSVAISPDHIWAVRIRATRTLEEAWTIFTEFVDHGGSDVCAWEEMFAKLISARKVARLDAARERALEGIRREHEAGVKVGRRLQRWDAEQRELEEHARRVLPGDAKEVVNPAEGVYVGSRPPGIEELFMMMRRVVGRRIGDRVVAMLVRESDSVEAGEWVLRTWSKEQFRRLKKGPSRPPSSPRILTSYLHLLSTSDPTPAIRLLLSHSPPYPPAWNTVLASLAASLASPHLDQPSKQTCATTIWSLYKAMTRTTAPDTETLRILSFAAERSLSLSILWDGVPAVSRLISVFSPILEFSANPTVVDDTPPLIVVSAATLHAYVRALGMGGRREEIVEVLKWMKGGEMTDMDSRMGRRVVVACRVFLGEEARGVVEELGVEWPGEEECEVYCVLGGVGGGDW